MTEAGHRVARLGWPLRARGEALAAAGAFAVLCVTVLLVKPQLMEPDDYAYRASLLAMTQGHLLTLSTAQTHVLTAQLAQVGARQRLAGGAGGGAPSIAEWQWVRLPDGRWISERDPGYPFLAAAFQALGVIRLAPLWYGALACLGLFAGARRWLGRYGGAVAVGLFCSCGAALFFAWRDYMPTFTDASLVAAGTGALLWAVLADEAAAARRTGVGFAGFAALEAAAFARYTDVVVLGCAVVGVLAARWLGRGSVPRGALWWWLGSVAVFCGGVAVFDDVVYGGPLMSGYRPGEVRFSAGAVPPNLSSMPPRLLQAMPMLVFGLVTLAWVTVNGVRARGQADRTARRDVAVAVALAASWLGVWALYATYTWTAQPGISTYATVRFYVPALGAISLLGAWLFVRVPSRAALASSALVIVALFALGVTSAAGMRGTSPQPRPPHVGRPAAQQAPPGTPGGAAGLRPG